MAKLQNVTVGPVQDPPPPPPSERPPPSNSFVGREEERSRLHEAVSAAASMISVTGPPGIGKSRLVEQLLVELSFTQPELGWTRVDLGPGGQREVALRRIGQAMSLRFGPLDDADLVVERITAALRSRVPFVLWLDNADTSLDALRADLATFGQAGPDLVTIVTSRRPLEGVDEILALPPLPSDESVRLLTDRARIVRPNFRISAAQRPSVLEIVRRLDGLPLALELLAPRLRLLTPTQLLERLDPAAAARDALGEAIDRSLEMLTPWEWEVLSTCSVFRDGFYLDAAEAVVDLTRFETAPDALTILEGLVAQSLLRTTGRDELADEVRIEPFSVVGQRVYERLGREPERRAELFVRHADYYVRAAERWDVGVESADEVECTARLILELPNLEAAYERIGDPGTRARLGLVLHLAYQRRGPFARQRELVDQIAVDARLAQQEQLVSRALLAKGRVERWGGEIESSDRALEEAMTIAARTGDAATLAGCARNLAANRFRMGDPKAARAPIERALKAAVTSGRVSDEINALNGLGYLHTALGEIDLAQNELETALDRAHRAQIPGLEALVHGSLSALMLRAERFEAGLHHSTRAIEVYERLGYLRQWASEHLIRGELRLWSGDPEGAERDARAALERAQFLGLSATQGRAELLLGVTAFHRSDYTETHERIEAAMARFDNPPPEAARLWAYAAAARALLGHVESANEIWRHRMVEESPDARIQLLEALVDVGRHRAGGEAKAPRTFERVGAEGRFLMARHEVESKRGASPVVRPAIRLEVNEDARWFRLGTNERIDLTRRRVLRGILQSLVKQHMSSPGAPLDLDGVLHAGWPGERMSPESGARRVYVTINRLRKLGLGEHLLTTGDGYMLTPKLDVVVLSQ